MESDALPTVRPHPPDWRPPTPDRDGLELPRIHIERLKQDLQAAQNPKRDLPPINRRVLKFNSGGSHSSDDSEELVFEQIHPAEYIDESPKDRRRIVLALRSLVHLENEYLACRYLREMLDKYSGEDVPTVRKRLRGILYAEKHLKEKLSIEKQSLLQHPPRTLDEMTQSTAKLRKIGKMVEGLSRDIETLEYVFVVFRKLNERLKRHGNGAPVLDRASIINHAHELYKDLEVETDALYDQNTARGDPSKPSRTIDSILLPSRTDTDKRLIFLSPSGTLFRQPDLKMEFEPVSRQPGDVSP